MMSILLATAVLAQAPSLSLPRQDSTIQDLIRRLGDPSFEEREKAEIELLRIGRKAVGLLEEAAGSSDPEVRLRARHVLQAIPFCDLLGVEVAREFARATGVGRVQVIRKQPLGDLGEEDGRLIADAILDGYPWRQKYDDSEHQRQLFKLGEEIEGGPMLLSWVFVRMAEHDHKYVRLHGIAGLKKMGAKKRARFVAGALGDSHHYVRQRAAEALGEYGAKEYLPEIEKLLEDPKHRVRWSAIEAMAKITGSWEMVARGLKDRESKVRGKAASLLDKMDAKAALEALRAARDEEEDGDASEVIESSIRSLEAFRGARRPIEVVSEWSGANSRIEERTYVRISSEKEWEKLWERHLETERPDVDFSRAMVIGIFKGKGMNSDGVVIASVAEDDDTIRFRFDDASYQTMGPGGGGRKVTAYGLFALPRSGKPVVLEENVQGLLGHPPVWRERARLP